ncbi:hypothetical protein J22TS3_42590 [Paenibacillus sp. J22TS3]|nr:hypothetical protein J22TS3_42590 [Paenibacillus sp. J22TS3]
MELYSFSKEFGSTITKCCSYRMHVLGRKRKDWNAPSSYPPATVNSLREGIFSGGQGETASVQAGDAVFWEKREWHETSPEEGLITIVIESEELCPSMYMTPKRESYTLQAPWGF